MEVNPLPRLLENTNILKHSFDIYECLSPCSECSGRYSGLGMKVRCRCDCHRKQKPVPKNDREWSAYKTDRLYLEAGISGRKFAGIDASNLTVQHNFVEGSRV